MKKSKFYWNEKNQKVEIWDEEVNGQIDYWEKVNGISQPITKKQYENRLKNAGVKTVSDAAKHFLELYADEIKDGEEITADAVNEWWIATKDQYPDSVTADDVEKEIFALI